MKRKLMFGFAFMFFGASFGAAIVLRASASQEYRRLTGYAFWSSANSSAKSAYLVGYADAEQMYRGALDNGAKPRCTDAGKAWIEDLDHKFPMPNITFKQEIEGLDEFYKDFKNQGVNLWFAQNIVRLQISGRPQPEIDEAIKNARAAAIE